MGLALFSGCQALTRFVRDRCDSEQELEASRVKESWLVDRILDFMSAKHAQHAFEFDTFMPVEFSTGRAGGARRIDLVEFPRRRSTRESASFIVEVKLMMEKNRPWADEIVSDIFRVACARHLTTTRTLRYVMVVGQERCLAQTADQCGGLLRKMCPMDRRHSFLTLGLTNTRRSTSFTDRWKSANADYLEDYLKLHLPKSVTIELAGFRKSHRDHDEQEERGITARMWRILPGACATHTEPDRIEPVR